MDSRPKNLFSWGEIGQSREWNHDSSLDWHLLENPFNKGLQRWIQDLNQFYRRTPAMHANIELEFVIAFERSDDIKLYAKLPEWFKIDTSLGTYNPDRRLLNRHNYYIRSRFILVFQLVE
ncbi:restriction endonuclease [Desulfobacter sp.]